MPLNYSFNFLRWWKAGLFNPSCRSSSRSTLAPDGRCVRSGFQPSRRGYLSVVDVIPDAMAGAVQLFVLMNSRMNSTSCRSLSCWTSVPNRRRVRSSRQPSGRRYLSVVDIIHDEMAEGVHRFYSDEQPRWTAPRAVHQAVHRAEELWYQMDGEWELIFSLVGVAAFLS